MKYEKRCSGCNVVQSYCNKYKLKNAIKHDIKCKSCAHITNKNKYEINCKSCNDIIILIMTEHAFINRQGIYKEYCNKSCASSDRIRTEEWNNNISKGHIGLTHSEETKIKIGLSGLGREPWNKGLTKFEDERLMKMSKEQGPLLREMTLNRHGYKNLNEYLEHDGDEKYKYMLEVRRLTEQHNLSSLENYDKRGKDGYHLDHIIPIIYGFKNNIPAKDIAKLSNLQMIPWKENLQKSSIYEGYEDA